jgi:GntR family transcriptional regulator/MocR family aminotransferase
MFWLSIDRTQNMPMIRQIYEQIRLHILSGELRQGERLPSTRDLAENLHVSRNVIIEAYDQLIAEGYMASLRGSGTYVAEGTYWRQTQLNMPMNAGQIQDQENESNHKDIIDFRFGVPALDLFPRKKWSHLFHDVCTSAPSSVFGYGIPEGLQELRQVLSHYLVRTRGVHCEPEQVIITTGSIQAIFMVANLLLCAKDQVITEDPMNINVRKIFFDTGAHVLSIPVDEQGIRVDLIPGDTKPRLIYLTPSHHFPLGGTLPIQRRIELIEMAKQKGCYILEDNYDNEFRFEGTSVSSLQGLEPELVIYTGTFSKILAPALRIGYLVVPAKLTNDLNQLKNLLDHHSPSLNQLVLTMFIEQGYFDHHIAKMKKIYRKRRDTLIQSLNSNFPGKHKVSGHSTGLHLVVEFDNVTFTDQVLDRLEEAGLRVYPIEMYAINKGYYQNRVLLGYGNVTEDKIIEGIKRMNSVL